MIPCDILDVRWSFSFDRCSRLKGMRAAANEMQQQRYWHVHVGIVAIALARKTLAELARRKPLPPSVYT